MTARQKEQKTRQFITLRTAGASYSEIAREIGVSKQTAIEWGKTHKAAIDEAKQEAIEDALKEGKHTPLERLSRVIDLHTKIIDKVIERLKSENDNIRDLMQARELVKNEINALASQNTQEQTSDARVIVYLPDNGRD
jgi:transposase-like protein